MTVIQCRPLVSTRSAPALARARANPWPSPRFVPVTIATRPLRSKIVVVIQKFHGYTAQQNRFVPDARAESVIRESAVLIVVVQTIQLEVEVTPFTLMYFAMSNVQASRG